MRFITAASGVDFPNEYKSEMNPRLSKMNARISQYLLACGIGVRLLLPIALCTAGSILIAIPITEVQAQALHPEEVARIAEAITVRIEGATQGSGVLVEKEGAIYTVLTSWHVVSDQRRGEEIAVYTPDGRVHQVLSDSIQRIAQVDIALLRFSSPRTYALARIGSPDILRSGSDVYVSGMPLSTSSVPARIFRFLDSRVIANSPVALPNGYQLLYSNQTLPGMSGGAVLDSQGRLVGIHGRGETDDRILELSGVAVKTGTSQAVPINFYKAVSLQAETSPNAQGPSPSKDPAISSQQLDRYQQAIEAQQNMMRQLMGY